MADDVRVDNGDGPLVRAVEIGGKLYQAVILHDAAGVSAGTSSNPVVVESGTLSAEGDEQLSVTSGAAVGFASIPAGAKFAVVQTDQDVRYRDTGGNPTATRGRRVLADGELFYDGADLAAIKFIAESATATLEIAYYA